MQALFAKVGTPALCPRPPPCCVTRYGRSSGRRFKVSPRSARRTRSPVRLSARCVRSSPLTPRNGVNGNRNRDEGRFAVYPFTLGRTRHHLQAVTEDHAIGPARIVLRQHRLVFGSGDVFAHGVVVLEGFDVELGLGILGHVIDCFPAWIHGSRSRSVRG